ncbi:MAG: plasmid pRiA4b ORF-3 family protein [Phycisphaerae bacterium]|nr:plasmid pRiA4b ORF-3 family protein [Phycisphaerae bacterium]
MATKPTKIYQLEIWLNEIKPRIWRKLEVSASVKLDKLHEIIQEVMGWTNSHLHSFNVDGYEYSMPYPGDEAYNEGVLDERKAKLTDLVGHVKDRFVYVYDYGDNWEHTVELVEIKEPQKGVKYPVCLDGQRACPPEDCGGPWSYPELLETLNDPDHEEYEEVLEWVGDEFDPEVFDVNEVNDLLR